DAQVRDPRRNRAALHHDLRVDAGQTCDRRPRCVHRGRSFWNRRAGAWRRLRTHAEQVPTALHAAPASTRQACIGAATPSISTVGANHTDRISLPLRLVRLGELMNRISIMRIAPSTMDCRGIAVAIGIVLLLVAGARAQQPAGSVRSVQGEAFAESGAARRALALEAAILLGDHVGTGVRSQVTMLLGRDTTL